MRVRKSNVSLGEEVKNDEVDARVLAQAIVLAKEN